MAPEEKKQGFLHFIFNLFKRKKSDKIDETIHLEPQYWPEVRDFMKNLNNLIETHTITDTNLQGVNQRILDYVLQQINIKGSIQDIEERYVALNTLADRILLKNLGKIVGLKENASTHADFSDAVEHFKKQLHIRYQAELKQPERKKEAAKP